MDKKIKNQIIFMVLALIGVWTILSIFIPEKCISRLSLWASLVVGSGTTITSVLALMISIMSYKKTEMLRIKKIEEDAVRFTYSLFSGETYLMQMLMKELYCMPLHDRLSNLSLMVHLLFFE